MAETSERETLVEALSARVLAHMDTASMIADIRVSNAQISSKMDDMKADLQGVTGALPALDTRVTKLESWQKFVMIAVGALWAVALAFIGAYAYKITNGGTP